MSIICECGHPLEVHNQFNCIYAFEKEDECHCPLGKETVIARYWAKRMSKELDKVKKELEEQKNKLNYFLSWVNANRND